MNPITPSILTGDPYSHYRVKLEFRSKCFGGYPKNPALIASWIKATTGHDDDQTKEQITAAEQAMADQAKEESTWIGFPNDETGIYLENRHIKSGLRECFSVARIFVVKPGTKQLFQHATPVDGLINGSRDGVPEGRVYLMRKGKVLKEADGYVERPIHPDTAQGKRSALKRADYVEQAQVEFLLRVLKTAPADKRHIGRDEIEQALVIFQDDGLGADRSQQFGRFNVIELEELPDAEDGQAKPRRAKH